jgi:ATP-binding cassette subfamily B protein
LPGLRAALTPPLSPVRAALDALRADGLLAPGVLALAVLVAALGVTLEATVLRGLMDFHTWLVRDSLRLTLAVGIFSFAILLFLLEAALTTLSLRLGRRVETRLRIALLTKIPQIEERYFHSRLISDMAYRAYSLTQLHSLPGIGVDLLRQSAQLLFTTIGVVWLAPQSALLAFAMLGAVMAVALFSQPIVGERDLRVRTHTSALSRFYLDALLGLLPIRSHSAERVVRREHEMLLTTWMRALRELANLELLLQGSVALIGLGGACAIVLSYIGGGGEASGVLLLLYWALNLPVLGQAFVTNAQQYPRARNHLLRLLEPLGAPTKTDAPPEKEPLLGPEVGPELTALPDPSWTQGVAVVLRGVTAVAAGHPILHDLNLTIEPGEHIALVGTSGAGKSSLAGLLLGWHRPTQGEIWVDGQRLTETRLQSLRKMTAWVDPAVLLWNRSLSANLLYGLTEEEQEQFALNDALTLADLDVVAAKLAEGLATGLGEGGGLISGGEGQRVRFARALLRPGVRLAILDEPFRGLESSQRRQLLARARQHWRTATLLCITHDVADTQTFDRVVVLDNGRIVEEGAPQQLADDPHSHYRGWLDVSAASWQTLWNAEGWRHLHLEQGQLHER